MNYVGSQNEKFDMKYNKFSEHYDRKNDKTYGGDDRIVYSKTFMVKMEEKCRYDPKDSFALNEDGVNDKTKDYR